MSHLDRLCRICDMARLRATLSPQWVPRLTRSFSQMSHAAPGNHRKVSLDPYEGLRWSVLAGRTDHVTSLLSDRRTVVDVGASPQNWVEVALKEVHAAGESCQHNRNSPVPVEILDSRLSMAQSLLRALRDLPISATSERVNAETRLLDALTLLVTGPLNHSTTTDGDLGSCFAGQPPTAVTAYPLPGPLANFIAKGLSCACEKNGGPSDSLRRLDHQAIATLLEACSAAGVQYLPAYDALLSHGVQSALQSVDAAREAALTADDITSLSRNKSASASDDNDVDAMLAAMESFDSRASDWRGRRNGKGGFRVEDSRLVRDAAQAALTSVARMLQALFCVSDSASASYASRPTQWDPLRDAQPPPPPRVKANSSRMLRECRGSVAAAVEALVPLCEAAARGALAGVRRQLSRQTASEAAFQARLESAAQEDPTKALGILLGLEPSGVDDAGAKGPKSKVDGGNSAKDGWVANLPTHPPIDPHSAQCILLVSSALREAAQSQRSGGKPGSLSAATKLPAGTKGRRRNSEIAADIEAMLSGSLESSGARELVVPRDVRHLATQALFVGVRSRREALSRMVYGGEDGSPPPGGEQHLPVLDLLRLGVLRGLVRVCQHYRLPEPQLLHATSSGAIFDAAWPKARVALSFVASAAPPIAAQAAAVRQAVDNARPWLFQALDSEKGTAEPSPTADRAPTASELASALWLSEPSHLREVATAMRACASRGLPYVHAPTGARAFQQAILMLPQDEGGARGKSAGGEPQLLPHSSPPQRPAPASPVPPPLRGLHALLAKAAHRAGFSVFHVWHSELLGMRRFLGRGGADGGNEERDSRGNPASVPGGAPLGGLSLPSMLPLSALAAAEGDARYLAAVEALVLRKLQKLQASIAPGRPYAAARK